MLILDINYVERCANVNWIPHPHAVLLNYFSRAHAQIYTYMNHLLICIRIYQFLLTLNNLSVQ